eukprot:jgi/Tetstr1/457323/TSEL_043927.t1
MLRNDAARSVGGAARGGSGVRVGLRRGDSRPRRQCYHGPLAALKEVPRGPLEELQEPFEDDWAPGPYVDASGGYCRTLAPLQLRPTGCELAPLSPPRLLRLLAGRRLVLWGCSLTRQLFEYLAGRLRAHALPGNPELVRGPRSYLVPGCEQVSSRAEVTATLGPARLTLPCFRTPYAELSRECLRYAVPGADNQTAALCYIYARRELLDADNLGAYHALADSDIVLANVGAHFNVPQQYHTALARLRDVLAASRPGPLLVWRESTAQHFGVTPGGAYPPRGRYRDRRRLSRVDPATFRCTQWPMSTMVKKNFRDTIARRVLGSAFPVFRLWEVTAMAHTQHPQTLRGGGAADCTHWCSQPGGMLEVWSTMLLNYLEALLRHEAAVRAAQRRLWQQRAEPLFSVYYKGTAVVRTAEPGNN